MTETVKDGGVTSLRTSEQLQTTLLTPTVDAALHSSIFSSNGLCCGCTDLEQLNVQFGWEELIIDHTE